jgi:predicted TIM-barrel fold metal-dependent hydrolase
VAHPKGAEPIRALDVAAGVEESALIVIARRGNMDATRAQNDAVLAAAAASLGHFYAVVSVNPLDGEAALTELERLAKLGAKEVKLHPNTQNFDVSDPSVAAVVDRCGQLGLVVLFDSYKPWDASEMGKFILLAAQHPHAKIVLAHMGFSYFREAVSFSTLERLGMGGNVWFDISAIAPTYAGSPLVPELVWTMRKVGISHVIFGSDWPVYTPAESIEAVRSLGLSADEQRKVFHDNVAELLGLQQASAPGK